MNAVLRVSWTGQSIEYWQGVLQGSQGGAAGVGAVLHRHGLPKRLADALCHEAGVTATPLAQLKKVIFSFMLTYFWVRPQAWWDLIRALKGTSVQLLPE